MTRPDPPPGDDAIAVVVIGRNEGERLQACLGSIKPPRRRTIYVDSGSTDGSVAFALSADAAVVRLDMSSKFTAARARNAGFEALELSGEAFEFVQFVDGDCSIVAGWIETAALALRADPTLALVCGRRRERHPERTVFNELCDAEWNTPVGEALECGGDVLMRADAFRSAGGYAADLIAGEEPELCVRLRETGWRIRRIDADMTWHDADIRRFSQWWSRCRRAGYAFAQVARRHRASPFGIWRAPVRRAVFWGAAFPLLVLAGALAHPAMLAGALAYPLQVCRLAIRRGASEGASWRHAAFAMIGKFAEAQGVAAFHLDRLLGRNRAIIEYKRPVSGTGLA